MAEFDDLIAGYRRFRMGDYRQQRERYDRLAHEGQSPRMMIIACSDSRTDPSRVFDTAPGQVFMLRNIANLVPPYSAIEGQSSVAAALEYAVTQLHVELIVVFGHARCGGIAAALAGDFDNPVAGRHIHAWMEFIAPARDAVKAAAVVSPISMPPAPWNRRRCVSVSTICAAIRLWPRPRRRGHCVLRAVSSISAMVR